MIKLVKKCPSCGHENPETEHLCISCQSDLSGTRAQRVAPVSCAGANLSAIWTCPRCHTGNDNILLLCSSCGKNRPDASKSAQDATHTPEGDSRESSSRLILVVGREEHECREHDILGREGSVACHVFQGIPTVSRRHLELTRLQGQWYMTALSGATNSTTLDGRDIPINQPQLLKGDHAICLSKRCEIHLRVC